LIVNITPPAVNAARYSTTCVSPITILANATSATCTVTAVANADVGDGTATATVTVLPQTPQVGGTYSVGNPSTASVAINDDDKATITIVASPTTITENGGVSTVTITATAPVGGTLVNGQSVSVDLSGSGTATTGRYASTCTTPQVINFTGAATATKTCTITGIDNQTADGDAIAQLTVNASGAYTVGNPSTASVTITDDEHAITVLAAVSTVTEGQAAVFNISCGGATGTFQVNYTISGADSGVTITPSDSSITLNCPTGGSVTVPTIDDGVLGNSRVVTLTITGFGGEVPAGVIIGSPSQASVNVLDNDRPNIIPTLSDLGLLMLVLTMAGFAGFAVRRKL
jgi:hypothetical protein